MKVMIVVTHLLGTGHLSRALTLGHAFAANSHKVWLVSGGMPAPHLRHDGLNVIQLPPLRSDGTDFTQLLDTSDTPAGAAFLARRTDLLCSAVRNVAPDVLVTELFPFGRRSLRAEFTALLEAAAALPRRPVILSSIRDILAPPSKPAKAQWAEDVIARHYDAVLVHADPSATRLETSWPVTDRLAPYLRYTGYVAPPLAAPHPRQAGEGEVLVSAGGGPVGQAIFETALATAHLAPQTVWRILIGGKEAEKNCAELQSHAPGNAIVEPARTDFRQMLRHAAASVSMCGYNTALDVLQAGTPAVFVPFDAGNEVEQGLRADNLARLDGVELLRNRDLSPDALHRAVQSVCAAPRRDVSGLAFDGSGQTVRLACGMAKGRL